MTKQKMPLKAWLPLIGMTVSAFIFNTSEFMPIGLLSDIAANFGITESHAGLLISVYSWVVTLLSLPLMLLVSKMSYRKLLLGTSALFGIFQVLSGVSASYGMLMVSRIGVACTHAIFWSVASPIAVRLVPEEHQTLAMSMIVTGTSVAMIFGLPLGRVIGLTVGWRMTFLCVAAVAFLVLFYLLFSLLLKIKSHARRSVVTYLCFAAGTCLAVEERSVLIGSLLIAGTVIYRHTFGCPGEEKNERIDLIM